MSSDLLRQRRNLVLFSSILWFLKFAEIEIDKFSIIGIEFSSFKNPHSLFIALWIAWIYFAIRYYQYFVQEGLPCFSAVFREILDNKSIKKIDSLVKNKFPQNIRKDVPYTILKKWNWEFSGQIDHGADGMGGTNIENFKMKIAKWHLLPEIIYTFFHIILNRSVFTDYFLPIIIAMIALFYCFSGWDGSIVTSFKSLIT